MVNEKFLHKRFKDTKYDLIFSVGDFTIRKIKLENAYEKFKWKLYFLLSIEIEACHYT